MHWKSQRLVGRFIQQLVGTYHLKTPRAFLMLTTKHQRFH